MALARAIVCEPRLILLDEPLAALDAEMRRQMRVFLKDLQRRIATTFLFVTHDQEEAITMSDRIVVMAEGKIEQVGTPKEIYYGPKTPFVARFFGDNNLIPAQVLNGRAETAIGTFPLPTGMPDTPRPLLATIRPEKLQLGTGANGASVPCSIEDVVFVGASTHVRVRPLAAPDLLLLVKATSDPQGNLATRGATVTVLFDPADVTFVESAS